MIAIGCDHGGFALKQEIMEYLDKNGYEYKDFGCYSEASVDYPEYAKKVCAAINDGSCDRGILICGTGIGISIAANKIKEYALHSALTVLWLKLQDFIMMPMCLLLEEE